MGNLAASSQSLGLTPCSSGSEFYRHSPLWDSCHVQELSERKRVNFIQGCYVSKPTKLTDLKSIPQPRHYCPLPDSCLRFTWFPEGYKWTGDRTANGAGNEAWGLRQRLNAVSLSPLNPQRIFCSNHAKWAVSTLCLSTPMPPLLRTLFNQPRTTYPNP